VLQVQAFPQPSAEIYASLLLCRLVDASDVHSDSEFFPGTQRRAAVGDGTSDKLWDGMQVR